MTSYNIMIAGFGGQGILFAGKVLAYTGMVGDKNVSWLPSYGPEMRGGTANCHVIISPDNVGSPIIINPNILLCMNKPSLAKFESSAEEGGYIFLDTSLVEDKTTRDDVKVIGIPATQMAHDIGNSKLANMVMLGKVIKETGLASIETLETGLAKAVPANKAELLKANLTAVRKGYDY